MERSKEIMHEANKLESMICYLLLAKHLFRISEIPLLRPTELLPEVWVLEKLQNTTSYANSVLFLGN